MDQNGGPAGGAVGVVVVGEPEVETGVELVGRTVVIGALDVVIGAVVAVPGKHCE